MNGVNATEYHLAMRKKGKLAICSEMDKAWGTMQSEISHRREDKYCMFSLIWTPKIMKVMGSLRMNLSREISASGFHLRKNTGSWLVSRLPLEMSNGKKKKYQLRNDYNSPGEKMNVNLHWGQDNGEWKEKVNFRLLRRNTLHYLVSKWTYGRD